MAKKTKLADSVKKEEPSVDAIIEDIKEREKMANRAMYADQKKSSGSRAKLVNLASRCGFCDKYRHLGYEALYNWETETLDRITHSIKFKGLSGNKEGAYELLDVLSAWGDFERDKLDAELGDKSREQSDRNLKKKNAELDAAAQVYHSKKIELEKAQEEYNQLHV